MKKRMFLFLLLVLLCLCAFCAGAQVVTEGNYEFEIPDGDFDPTGAATLCSYLGGNGDTLTLPLWCQGYPVTAIGNRAFLNRSELKQVVISSRVQSVGESAFEKCSGLTDVSFSEGLSVLSDRAFYGCASLTACDFPNSLREIGESCFEGCTALSSVDPPQRLQTIKKRAFYGCESLLSIRIYGKVRQIGESAFESCTALTTVQLADGVMTIGRRAFAKCSALVSANLTSSLAEIGEEAFRDCKSFQGEQYATDENGDPQYQLQVYGNIGTIGKSAYEGCDALRFIVFAAGAELTICDRAFANCAGLLSAGFPTSLRSIGERAFYGCKRLQSATFKEDSKGGIETIGESAFDGCSILCYPARGEDGSIIYRTLALPSTLKSIGKRAFYGCGIRSLGFTVGTQGISIGESAFESNLSLTQVAIFGDNTEGDISVGSAAFRGCSNMTTLILSERITHIGVSAFQNCSKLTQLGERYAKEDGTMATRGYYLPAALRSVGANAFRGCAALTIVALHATTSAVSLGDSVFMECTSLTRAVLPSSVTVLPRNIFRGCSNMTTFTLPTRLVSIGGSALEGCSSLPSLAIPASVTSIGDSAFRNCAALAEVSIKSGLQSIGSSAFLGCTSILNLILPDTLTSIGTRAFSGLPTGSAITIPVNVTSIGKDALSSLTTVYGYNPSDIKTYCETNSIPFVTLNEQPCGDGVRYALEPGTSEGTYTLRILGKGTMRDYESMDQVPWANQRGAITALLVEEGISHVGAHALEGCEKLTAVTLGNSITSIGTKAFSGCKGLTAIVLPSSLSTLADAAFQDCSELSAISLPDGISTLGKFTFSNIKSDVHILAPSSITDIGDSAFPSSAKVYGSPDSLVQHWCANNNIVFVPLFGPCGENAEYALTVSLTNGALSLTISGTGAMKNYSNEDPAPWTNRKGFIVTATVESGITTIGNYALSGCAYLTKISLPDSITSIGEAAFNGCKKLSSVSFSDDVTSLGSFVFEGCEALASVSFSASMNEIPEAAFKGCEALVSLSIPKNIKTIGISAFEGCKALTAVRFMSGLTSISASAFKDCETLSTVSLPLGLISLGDSALSDLATGARITVPDSLTEIGKTAFSSGCTVVGSADAYAKTYCEENDVYYEIIQSCGDAVTYALSTLESGNYLLTLSGSGATYDFELNQAPWNADKAKIEQLTVGSGITRIGSYAFAGCTALKTVSLPSTLKQIGERAFQGSTPPVIDPENPVNVTINLPKGVTKIESFAFRNCKALAAISFASDTALTEIPDGMLEGCSRLSSVSIPDGVTTVGANAFHACTALARVSLPSSLKTLGPSAFDGCPALRTAQLRNTELETIPSRAFAGCTKLQDFSFPSGLDSIGDSAFSGCQQLEREMIIPDSVESIGSSAFKSCTSLYSVTLPQNLKILGASAFSTCTGLCHIGIAGSEENLLPQSLTVINEHTFEDCVSLASLTLPSKLSSLGDFVFSGCSKLVAMDIPGKVTTLGSSVFANCESLIRVALPQNITAIGASCFRNCSVLPEIDLPVSLLTLGSYAFQNCRLLSGIAVPSGVTALPDGIFYNCTALRTIDAPNATSAGNSAFFSCQQLTNASFAQQFTLLGESAFENCVSLTRVVLSGNLSEIKKRTFFGCSSLCGVSIPEGIGSVGERAFCNCVSLTEILFPASLKTIEVDAFKGCSSLSAVTIPEGENEVTLRSGAFSGLPKKARVYLPRNLTPIIATDVFTSGTVIWGHRLASDGTSNSNAWNCAKNHSLKFTNVDGDKYSAAISVSDITVGLGITRDAEVSIFPLGTEYTLSSSNPTIVVVEGRKLRGVSLGNADLTVTCGSVSKTAKITVSQAASSFTVPNLVLVRNSVGQISPVVSPADATTEFSYTHYGATADAGGSIVTVNAKGKVTAIELGEASILVTDAISGISKPCHITVAYSADSIVFSPSVQTLCLGIPEPVNLWVDIRDTRLRNVFSTFSSEDPTIASVSLDGIVTPHAIGQTTITAKSGSKLSAKMTLLVTTGQNLPASATTVRDEAFAGTAFTRLVVPEGYTSIGSRAFANNKALRYLALPDSLRADGIPGNMLEGCDKKKLTIVCASENSDAAKWAADNGFTVLVP